MIPESEGAKKPLLNVFLLTYNREKSLRRTLEAIELSPLRNHPLTVMDNCTTDGTPQVCEEFLSRLPLMTLVRHPRNIGFGANYLRSIELSKATYTWIICDDDTLFPERMQSMIDLLENSRPRAVFVGCPRQEQWPSGTGLSPREINRQFKNFLTAQSFVPGLLYETALIGSFEIQEGFFNINSYYPQLMIGTKLLVEDIPIAVLDPPVLRREDPAEKTRSHMKVLDGWSAICRTLPPELRDEAFYSTFLQPDKIGMIKEVLRLIVWAKIDGAGDIDFHLCRIRLNIGPSTRVPILVCRMAALLPPGFFNAIRETYRKIKYGLLRRPLPASFNAPLDTDILRR
jgi:glycosyltransferase involved in cell wall biosynthesis